jgi:enoyl-CoA hydratase/carnithine racemase
MRGFAFIRLSAHSRVAWIEFDSRPVNAFTSEMVVETRDAIASALSDPAVRVIVIASAISEYFSAGADLRAFERMRASDMRLWVSLCYEIARLLRTSPKPLLAAIARQPLAAVLR